MEIYGFFRLTVSPITYKDKQVNFCPLIYDLYFYLAKPTPLLTPLASLSILVEMT